MEHLITRAEQADLDLVRTQHQFNDNAIRLSRNLSQNTGMQRIGVHVVTLEPGRDSTTHHYHDADEEFIYVIAGRGIARIGDEQAEIGPGDFMGFPAPSPAHSMSNPFTEDLIYLMGGERWAVDVVHYPDLQRSMTKSNGNRTWAKWSDIHDLPPRK